MRDHPLSLGQGTSYLAPHEWLGSVSYRWLHSDRIIVDSHEEAFRGPVINEIHFIDLTATYQATERLSISLDLPFLYGDRTTTGEHDGKTVHTMHAGGLGDLRLLADFWLLDPAKHADENVSFGLGVKAPTGDDRATDYAYRASGPVLRPVNASIQPGDGGWGIILEMQAFTKVFKNTFAYLSGSYLINPRNENGVEHTNGDIPSPPNPLGDTIGRINSVPDQYVGRGGFSYALWPKEGLWMSLGARIEGVPVHDLIGGSDGYRVPGYSISIEPGLALIQGRNIFSVSAPVAVDRYRPQSVPNLCYNFHGAASLADFLILASYSRRF